MAQKQNKEAKRFISDFAFDKIKEMFKKMQIELHYLREENIYLKQQIADYEEQQILKDSNIKEKMLNLSF